MSKSDNSALNAALHDGWASACRLYEHLAQGGSLAPLPPGTLRMNPGEIQFGDALLGYARMYGAQVSYQQSSSIWFGSATFMLAGMAAEHVSNKAAQRRAEAMAAVQWRDHAYLRCVLTNHRMLCDVGGSWQAFWHQGAIEFIADLSRWAFVLRHEGGDPLMIHGPGAPWFAVATARILYGPRGLQLPAFGPLAAAMTHRRTVTGEVLGPLRSALPPGPDSPA
ncbi:MAG: hypothetical protein HKP61_09635 [Dactylosporangium sp.]|nr:hypothetical protein [Dactylosporangium sp.]NNJ61193.1 hypothetical protein [Dactylosporangium sp.]